MGPETDSRLEDIGDALEGKKVLQEPYVDKKTILMALKEQNAVIRMMQMAFFQNQERMQVRRTSAAVPPLLILERYEHTLIPARATDYRGDLQGPN